MKNLWPKVCYYLLVNRCYSTKWEGQCATGGVAWHNVYNLWKVTGQHIKDQYYQKLTEDRLVYITKGIECTVSIPFQD